MKTPEDVLAAMHALRRFRDQIDELMNALGDKRSVTTLEKTRLQELLTALKDDLKKEKKRGDTQAGEDQLNEIEHRYLMPAIREVNSRLRVATNSHPINSRWASELYSARGDITYVLGQLESQYPEA